MILRVTDIVKDVEVDLGDIRVGGESLIAIDASTNNTGVCIIRNAYFKDGNLMDGQIEYSISMKRGKGLDAIEYKVEFKQLMKELLSNSTVRENVRYIVQEAPFISAMKETSSVLLSLRTSIPELLIENKAEFKNNYEYHELNNKAWKKRLFAPDKCPNNSELEKAIARVKVSNICSLFETLSQDEVDAAGIGIASTRMLACGEELKEKQRISKFKYNIEFIGAFDIEDAFEEISNMNIPDEVIRNGAEIMRLPSNGNIEKKIYETMGQEDKLLVFEFTAKNGGNLILKYRLRELADESEKMYGVVWREKRKAKK